MARSFEVALLYVLRWGARVERRGARRGCVGGQTTGGAPACIRTTALAPSFLAALSVKNTNVIPNVKVSPRDLLFRWRGCVREGGVYIQTAELGGTAQFKPRPSSRGWQRCSTRQAWAIGWRRWPARCPTFGSSRRRVQFAEVGAERAEKSQDTKANRQTRKFGGMDVTWW